MIKIVNGDIFSIFLYISLILDTSLSNVTSFSISKSSGKYTLFTPNFSLI